MTTVHDITSPSTRMTGHLGPDRAGTTAQSTRTWPVGRERLGFVALLVGTGALYLINLSVSGWANQFYAAAAQAGSKSWKAFLFGSLDQSNYITVDKPPASLWVMDLSVRLFGVNSWAVLVPQALEGVAAVALLYAAVKRVSGPNAGLLAGAALALTPVATLMFRYDNPDALLVLLMTAAAYAVVRALQAAPTRAGTRWLVLAGALLGFAFLTKMLQGLLVVPGLAVAYLICANTPVRRRLFQLAAGGLAMVVAAGWWIALVELWPAGSRPYIGGSTDNSILQLIFGYNGVGRLTGGDNNGAVGGTTGSGFSSGETGVTRLFGSEMGTQISWLLPAALVAIAALVWITWRRPRTDLLRASLIVWGGWLLVTGIVFSFASGIIHPYYTVALAPAIAALVGVGVVELWRRRLESNAVARWVLVALVAVSAVWTYQLLARSSWHPEVRWIALAAGALAIVALLVPVLSRALIVAPLLSLALLLGPAAYSVQTASTAHTGALPSAGPTSTSSFGGGGFGGGRPGGFGGGTRGGFGGASSSGSAPRGGPPSGGFPGSSGTGSSGTGSSHSFGGGRPSGRGGGGMGGLGGASTVDSALRSALQKDASSYTWVAATTSDNEAASLELATGNSVMAIGGYNGTDNATTLSAFERLVKAGRIHYYVADGQGFIGSTAANTSVAYRIEQWVEKNYTSTTIGGTTVYDLTAGTS
ncbi:glycosyltransferase family 39 protein [Jatrophihabitans endophyticus]|uniref:ArnT family glycosyltransferase n=1 Tax=Jatrophihabitans endophyticus TaxID=1206085 RepID=UPI001A02EF55|nr:glycosyltransferase family 39 protein [Jatrophihabitans endophyticus]MBE7187688.1 glycosyltransferase family 39 protein [Jatrophihabitans endophyticus]